MPDCGISPEDYLTGKRTAEGNYNSLLARFKSNSAKASWNRLFLQMNIRRIQKSKVRLFMIILPRGTPWMVGLIDIAILIG